MDYRGKTHLLFVIIAPPDQVEEGDRIFRSHGPWMEKTHPRDGEKGLLTYNVSKAPELANPMEPNPTPTGNTCFILDEIYESDAGVDKDWWAAKNVHFGGDAVNAPIAKVLADSVRAALKRRQKKRKAGKLMKAVVPPNKDGECRMKCGMSH